MNLTQVRQRISREMANLSEALHSQRALGGYVERVKFECTNAELQAQADGQVEDLKQTIVKLVVLQEAIHSNPLVKWFVVRASMRIAKAIDAVGPV